MFSCYYKDCVRKAVGQGFECMGQECTERDSVEHPCVYAVLALLRHVPVEEAKFIYHNNQIRVFIIQRAGGPRADGRSVHRGPLTLLVLDGKHAPSPKLLSKSHVFYNTVPPPLPPLRVPHPWSGRLSVVKGSFSAGAVALGVRSAL